MKFTSDYIDIVLPSTTVKKTYALKAKKSNSEQYELLFQAEYISPNGEFHFYGASRFLNTYLKEAGVYDVVFLLDGWEYIHDRAIYSRLSLHTTADEYANKYPLSVNASEGHTIKVYEGLPFSVSFVTGGEREYSKTLGVDFYSTTKRVGTIYAQPFTPISSENSIDTYDISLKNVTRPGVKTNSVYGVLKRYEYKDGKKLGEVHFNFKVETLPKRACVIAYKNTFGLIGYFPFQHVKLVVKPKFTSTFINGATVNIDIDDGVTYECTTFQLQPSEVEELKDLVYSEELYDYYSHTPLTITDAKLEETTDSSELVVGTITVTISNALNKVGAYDKHGLFAKQFAEEFD